MYQIQPSRRKQLIKKYKVPVFIAAFAVTAAAAVLMYRGLRMHDEFLEEKGLYDEYYFVPEDE